MVRLVQHALTQREVDGAVDGPGVLSAVLTGDLAAVTAPGDLLDLDGYVVLPARSGFPEPALRLGTSARQVWLDSYLKHLVTRDVAAAGQIRDPVRLRLPGGGSR